MPVRPEQPTLPTLFTVDPVGPLPCRGQPCKPASARSPRSHNPPAASFTGPSRARPLVEGGRGGGSRKRRTHTACVLPEMGTRRAWQRAQAGMAATASIPGRWVLRGRRGRRAWASWAQTAGEHGAWRLARNGRGRGMGEAETEPWRSGDTGEREGEREAPPFCTPGASVNLTRAIPHPTDTCIGLRYRSPHHASRTVHWPAWALPQPSTTF